MSDFHVSLINVFNIEIDTFALTLDFAHFYFVDGANLGVAFVRIKVVP